MTRLALGLSCHGCYVVGKGGEVCLGQTAVQMSHPFLLWHGVLFVLTLLHVYVPLKWFTGSTKGTKTGTMASPST